MTLIVTVQENLRRLAISPYSTGKESGLYFAADCLDAEAAKIARLEAELASVTALHASAIADGLAMAKQIEANGLPTIADVVKAQVWLPAPLVTDWGSGMLVADVALSKDVSLTMFIHKDALAGLDQQEAT